MYKNFIRLFFFGLLSLTILAGSVEAQPTAERYTDVRLVPETSTIKAGDTITVATEINLAPHWHVYWQNPGDSGLPVKINWTLPEGIAVDDIQWPTPDKISYDILANYGYYNQVVLLQNITAPDTLPEGPITLKANVEMLVCNDICIPEYSDVSVTFNADNISTNNSPYIEQARSLMPTEITGTFSFYDAKGALQLELQPDDASILKDATFDTLEFFPIDWGIISHVANPSIDIKKNKLLIAHERGDQPVDEIETLKGLLVIKGEKGQNKGYAVSAKPIPVQADSHAIQPPVTTSMSDTIASKKDDLTWLTALYFALFGGLILNLMPCVFPVLSMKALSLIKMGKKENKLARINGIAYTLGIVLSFLAVGGVLLILKEAGTSVGWGFQLQNPIVVAILAYLLFIIGLNLVGFFEFSSRFSNVGNNLAQGNSLSSSFFTGVLATIVATPCTAPFMGAAMGFALTQPAIVSMSVFGALGFGLALPYLLLSYIPFLRKALPRPGPWMNTFKQFLSFPIFASAIWLVWVLDQQSGSYGVLLVLLGMLSIAFSVWLSHQKKDNAVPVLVKVLMVLFLALPVLSLTYITTTEDKMVSSEKTYTFGEAYSEARLESVLEEDGPVFVEMTAAWCITCKVNHAIAINTDETKKLFEEKKVRYLIGDWTNYDETITQYLQKFNRNGVPIYVYYGPRDIKTGERPDAVILPQVITQSIITQTIQQ